MLISGRSVHAQCRKMHTYEVRVRMRMFYV